MAAIAAPPALMSDADPANLERPVPGVRVVGGGQLVGVGHAVGHRVIELPTGLFGVKGRQHGEDRLAVLAYVDPSGGVGPPGSEALDEELEGRRGLPTPEEIAVDRVRQTVGWDGEASGPQRL